MSRRNPYKDMTLSQLEAEADAGYWRRQVMKQYNCSVYINKHNDIKKYILYASSKASVRNQLALLAKQEGFPLRVAQITEVEI